MNREQIVERVAKSCEVEESKGMVYNILDDAGFFNLLEAAEFAKKAIIELQDNKDGGLISPARWKLNAAIAKITGEGDS